MRKTFIRLFVSLFLAVLVFLPVCAEDTIVYLMRHAETQTDTREAGADPSLSAAGQARAAELAKILRDVKIDRVFSTRYNRTRQTAAPVAEASGLEIETYDPRESDAFIHELRAKPGVYVVSGHSNTTPEMVQALGGNPESQVQHWEYDRLYVVIFKEGSDEPTTILLRYGEVSREH